MTADLTFRTALAEMNGLDLGAEVGKKLKVNAERVYRIDSSGVPVRVDSGAR